MGIQTIELPSEPVQAPSAHPATVDHLEECTVCAGLVGLALSYLRLGTRVVAFETPGNPTIDVRRVVGLCWVLVGEELVAVSEDEAGATRIADALTVEALTPEAPSVRVLECARGFKVVQGGDEVDCARNPSRLKDALRLAEAWFPEELWCS